MSAQERYTQILTLYRSGQMAEAATRAASALRLSPRDVNILHLAGLIAESLGKLAQALAYLQRALELKPDWFEARFNYARLLEATGDHKPAMRILENLIERQPNFPPLYETLARFHQNEHHLQQALAAWDALLDHLPANDTPLHIKAKAERALLARHICAWTNTPTKEDIQAFPPQAALVFSDDPVLLKTAAQRAAQSFAAFEALPPPTWDHKDRLRIGYLSSDFHAHATAYLLAELFALHTKERFDVFAYSFGVDDGSEIRARIRQSVTHFEDLRTLSARGVAEKIRADEIDILIDLKGLTRGARPDILAYRPARHQLHWLGYPATTGLPFIDAFIADASTIPPENEKYFTEQVLRLPHCYQINDRARPLPAPQPRSSYGLPEEALVLASFNQTYKITPDIFDIWCRLLTDIPNAVLWLYRSNNDAALHLQSAAQAHGLDPARLLFADPAPLADHLARYACVDIALDTYPVGGHTTTSDALWCATPVVTCAGQSFASRVAASLLNASGLSDLVAADFASYEEIIRALAADAPRRAAIRASLTQNRLSLPLFDTPRFVDDWEKLLLTYVTSSPKQR